MAAGLCSSDSASSPCSNKAAGTQDLAHLCPLDNPAPREPGNREIRARLAAGDHTDNGDGTYWLYGLHWVFVIFTAPPLVALTLCVAITEGVMWMVDEWRIHGITVRLWLLPLLVVAALVGGVMYLLYGYDLVLI